MWNLHGSLYPRVKVEVLGWTSRRRRETPPWPCCIELNCLAFSAQNEPVQKTEPMPVELSLRSCETQGFWCKIHDFRKAEEKSRLAWVLFFGVGHSAPNNCAPHPRNKIRWTRAAPQGCSTFWIIKWTFVLDTKFDSPHRISLVWGKIASTVNSRKILDVRWEESN